jgi:hypothetical protein
MTRSAACNLRTSTVSEQQARHATSPSGLPTLTPQSAQQNWSGDKGQGNFNEAWGSSSPRGSGREMPRLYGARFEGMGRNRAWCSLRNVILDVCRIELGPSRRDPQRPLSEPVFGARTSHVIKSALQGASAMGSFVVSRRASSAYAERQPLGVMPWSTTLDFGVSVEARSAHANRACVRSSPEDRAQASNHRRGHDTRRCSLHNWTAKAVREVHG